jgi:hypothetical protein
MLFASVAVAIAMAFQPSMSDGPADLQQIHIAPTRIHRRAVTATI